MPQKNKYSFNLKGGGTLDFEGDNPPTDDEVEEAARQNKVELMPVGATPEAKQPTDISATIREEATKPPPPKYGLRPDGTPKGEGFFGALKLPSGKGVASEYSIADSEQLKDDKGNYIDYPSMVPTLTREELDAVLQAADTGQPVPESVKKKAEAFALQRKAQGKPLFADLGEQGKLPDYADTRGTAKKVWDFANKPLTDLPSQVAGDVANRIDSPSLDRGRFAAQVEGFLGGATQGIGDTMSSFTSPINLAAMLLSGGASGAAKAGWGGTSRALNAGANLANAAQVPAGAAKLLSPDSTWGERGHGLLEIAMGMSGLSDAPKVRETPKIDPNIEWGAKLPNAKPTGMGAARPPLSDEAATAIGIGKGSTKAANEVNIANATRDADIAAAKAAASKSKFVDPHAKYRAAKVGTEFTIKPADINRKKMDDFIALGYDYKDMDEAGNVIIRKIKDSPPVKEFVPKEYKTNKIMEALNAPRTLMASMDFSAPLRQGVGLIHRKEFWTSLDDMFKAWGSEGAYNAIMEDITKDPMFQKNINAKGEIKPSMAEEAGLKFTDLNSMSAREDSLKSSWAEKVPLVRRSNRAYTAFLNKLRADTFKSMIDDAKVLGQDGKVNKPLAKAFAQVINTSTGRGSLGALEPASNLLASVMFSPRLIASRLQMLNPHYYWALPEQARKEALKSLFAVAGFGATVVGLGKMAGGKVETDPASADFGKVQLGQTRLDPWAGFQQYIVAAERLPAALNKIGVPFVGRFKSTNTQRKYSLSNPGYGQSEPADVLERFMVGKANPVIEFAWQLMMRNQRELSGEKMNFKTLNPMENSIAQRFIPLLVQDMYDLIHEEGLQPKDAAIMPLATLGMGVQQFKKVRPH